MSKTKKNQPSDNSFKLSDFGKMKSWEDYPPTGRSIEKQLDEDKKNDKNDHITLTQWAKKTYNSYMAAGPTYKQIPSGFYNLTNYNGNPVFVYRDLNVDELIYFPNSLYDTIIQEIKQFWVKKDLFDKYGFLHRRGYLLYGPQGCHAQGTKILMYDGTTKNVEDIVVGDLLMGPNSQPRKVLWLIKNKSEMYEITPNKGNKFVVNSEHILHLNRNGSTNFIDISVADYLEMNKSSCKKFTLSYSERIDFKKSENVLPIDAYLFGLWLGDDNSIRKHNTINLEISDYLKNYYNNININNKYIPIEFLTASYEDRLKLIAGLIDSGSNFSYKYNYKFISKNESIIDGLVYLCKSVGLMAIKKEFKKIFKKDLYYKVNISGNLNIIPSNFKRKKFVCKTNKQRNNILKTKFKVKSLGIGDYYGFLLDDDHLYLTSDFMIHHNSGKSCMSQLVIKDVIERDGIVINCACVPDLIDKALIHLREVEPDRKVVCLFEDIDAIINIYGEDSLLSLLDGENQINTVLNLACPTPETLILKSDLTWEQVGKLKPNDEIIGFDENLNEDLKRKFQIAKINSCPIIEKPCYKIITNIGTVEIVSENHPFLVKSDNNIQLQWIKVQDLKVDDKILSIGNPTENLNSYNIDYLSKQYKDNNDIRLFLKYEKVNSVEYVGIKKVVALDTTTNTFIGEGLLQHNTTNYPEYLDKRIVSRPRRFDRVIRIDMPDAQTRKLYFEKKLKIESNELNKWVKATEGFSFAALAELVISVKCFEKPFEEAVKSLEVLLDSKYSSIDFNRRKAGFTNNNNQQSTFDEGDDIPYDYI